MDTKILSKKHKLHYLISLIIIALFVILSFLPILPIYSSGPVDESSQIIVTTIEYSSFFVALFHFISGNDFFAFLFASGIIGFYLCSIITIIYILIKDEFRSKLWLLLIAFFMLVDIFSLTYISGFAFIGFLSCVALFVMDFIVDYKANGELKDLQNKKALMTSIGKNIKQERIKHNMTQQELAEKVFVSRSLIAKVETGSVLPNKTLLKELSKVFNINLEYLVRDD